VKNCPFKHLLRVLYILNMHRSRDVLKVNYSGGTVPLKHLDLKLEHTHAGMLSRGYLFLLRTLVELSF
jgi:hypothetical protein